MITHLCHPGPERSEGEGSLGFFTEFTLSKAEGLRMKVFKNVVRGFSLVHDLNGGMHKNGSLTPP